MSETSRKSNILTVSSGYMIQWHLKLNNARCILIFFIQELTLADKWREVWQPCEWCVHPVRCRKVDVELSTWIETCLQHLMRLTRPQWLRSSGAHSKKQAQGQISQYATPDDPLSENTRLFHHIKTFPIKVCLGPKTKLIKHHTVNSCIIIQRQDPWTSTHSVEIQMLTDAFIFHPPDRTNNLLL